MDTEIIIRDYHLKKGDKVSVDGVIYEYIKHDGMYAKWLDSNGVIATGLFGNLYFDEKEKIHKPYKVNKS